MSKLKEALKRGKFVITGEIAPPKGSDIREIVEELEIYKEHVVAVNITDNQSSVMRASPLAIAKLLKEKNIEPVYQITCRDRNRLALQSELLGAAIFGIENILCLTGDAITQGDHPQAKQVFDIDAVQLIEIAKGLNAGNDAAGKSLQGKTNFFIGAAVSPCADPLEPELIKMEKKIKAGAVFFQTQAIYDISKFKKFMEEVKKFNVYILAGIVVLKSAKMARFMNKNVSGIEIPEYLIEEMEKATNPIEKGIEIAVRLISHLKELTNGIHIMPLGKAEVVPKIIKLAKLEEGI